MLSSVLRASIIVIVYNGEQYIERAVHSALGQTVTDIEVIVVDDGSSDGSADRVGRIKDSRLRLVRQSNQGPSAARNTGIREAKSEWIAFLDCDDWWTPEKLARQLAVSEGAGLVYSGAIFYDPQGREIERAHPTLAGHVLPELLMGNAITGGGSTAMVRRDVLDAVGGFRADRHYGEEWECWLRVAAREPFAFVPDLDVRMVSRPNSQGKQTGPMRTSCLAIVDEACRTYAAHLAHLRRPATIAVHYRAAIDYELVGQLPAARAELRKVLSLAPLHTRALRRLARLSWTMVRDARGARASEQA